MTVDMTIVKKGDILHTRGGALFTAASDYDEKLKTVIFGLYAYKPLTPISCVYFSKDGLVSDDEKSNLDIVHIEHAPDRAIPVNVFAFNVENINRGT